MIKTPVIDEIEKQKGARGGIAGLDSDAHIDVDVIADGALGTSKLGDDITAAGLALLDDANAAAQRTTLGAEASANKNAANGYAGLNASSRITKGSDTADDLIIDSSIRGPVMKSPDGNYWRLSVDNAGALATISLGGTKP